MEETKTSMRYLNVRFNDEYLDMIREIKNIIAAEMHVGPDSITDSDIIRWAVENFHHFKKETK